MKAKKINRRSLASEAASRWFGTYGENGRGYGNDKAGVLRALRKLGPSPDPDDVDSVIGNKSWTEVPSCDGCGKEHPRAVVRVGAEPDYESATAHLCKACVLQAVALFAATGDNS